MKNAKRILLTGATGSVGYEVLKQLYENKEGYELHLVARPSKKNKKLLSKFTKQVTVHYGDLTDEKFIHDVCENVDVVLHLGALIPPVADEQPELAYKINTLGSKYLVEGIEMHSPNAFFIYSSSVSVYGDRISNPEITVSDPLTPSSRDEYAVTKIKAEELIQKSKLNWSIWRLGAIMGGHEVSKLMFHMPLNTPMEIASTEDTGRAFVNAIGKEHLLSKRIFNLGGGAAMRLTYASLLDRSFKLFGLGGLDFPANAFAEQNFHCGYYMDGDDLEEILHFRKDNLDSYFDKVKASVPAIQKFFTTLFRPFIKYYLLQQSEPLEAIRKNNQRDLMHYFRQQNRPSIS